MTEDRASDHLEIPSLAAECQVCSRDWISVDELRLVEVASLYLDSHEGAGLERCEVCGLDTAADDHGWPELRRVKP